MTLQELLTELKSKSYITDVEDPRVENVGDYRRYETKARTSRGFEPSPIKGKDGEYHKLEVVVITNFDAPNDQVKVRVRWNITTDEAEVIGNDPDVKFAGVIDPAPSQFEQRVETVLNALLADGTLLEVTSTQINEPHKTVMVQAIVPGATQKESKEITKWAKYDEGTDKWDVRDLVKQT